MSVHYDMDFIDIIYSRKHRPHVLWWQVMSSENGPYDLGRAGREMNVDLAERAFRDRAPGGSWKI